jgi:hypothetical protein
MNTSTKRSWLALAGASVLASGVLIFLLLCPHRQGDLFKQSPERRPTPPVFDGPSDQLQRTVIVPTLDTPLPEGKTAVWCASFQVAWNELRAAVGNAPIRLDGAGDLVRELNEARSPDRDLVPEMYYATAGFARDGVAGRVRDEMKRRFPDAVVPPLDEGEAAVAYAYLAASLRFHAPYFEDRLVFTDSSGKSADVRAFGFRKQRGDRARQVREQAELLFAEENLNDELTACAIDLDKNSAPHQIVAARVPKRGSLAEMYADVGRRVRKSRDGERHPAAFDRPAELVVPVMSWRIDHSFRDLEGKSFLNPSFRGLTIGRAFQVIEFSLDETGADVKSEAGVTLKGIGPPRIHLDGPYLLYMKKRGAEGPFFVMWVENSELMAR